MRRPASHQPLEQPHRPGLGPKVRQGGAHATARGSIQERGHPPGDPTPTAVGGGRLKALCLAPALKLGDMQASHSCRPLLTHFYQVDPVVNPKVGVLRATTGAPPAWTVASAVCLLLRLGTGKQQQ